MTNPYAYAESPPVARLSVGARARFIANTYLHLFGAILAFTLIEVALFSSPWAERIATTMLGGSWLLVIGGFILVSWIASRAAHTARSPAAQYAALGGFVVAEALVFVPLLWIAFTQVPGAISSAAALTLGGFALLTFVVFWTRKDFSFLRTFLMWAGILALGLIVVSFFTSFQLGLWFSAAMVVVAGASVLYDTSNVLHHFPEDRHVGAALELFASVALMFWYVLRLVMSSRV
jgi:FtsH-binding integral membrane protein